MKIYTKKGDEGRTSFCNGQLIPKNDSRIEAFGSLDELNSIIGVTLCFISDTKVKKLLAKIQNDLFQIGADLGGNSLKITIRHVQELENKIDELEEILGLPKAFILPNGTQASAFLHLCRVTARRTERSLVAVTGIMKINPEILRYINRLSDLLYVLARQANKEVAREEQQPIYKYFE